MIVAKAGGPFTAGRRCPVCRQQHLTFERHADGYGFVCNYRQPDEHYHERVEQMRSCPRNTAYKPHSATQSHAAA